MRVNQRKKEKIFFIHSPPFTSFLPLPNKAFDGQLIPRVEFLLELRGGDEDATGALLRELPAILKYHVEHLESQVEILRSVAGLDDQEILRIILVFPYIVNASKERKLCPRISFLEECGLNSNEIFKFLTKAPLVLGLSFEGNIAYKLGFLVKIVYKYGTKEFTVAIGAVSRTSCENFSCEDMLLMSKKEKVEYLAGEMGCNLDKQVDFPAFLDYKLDSEGMSLNKLLSVLSERFVEKKLEEVAHKA
ncbi:hypothetical protein ACJRO7_006342 [Eucalyptus globulus]|uniref:Uncharacterized protein n=1 Tax=Eucalyptus globulus TaxID=34317 RepID=A0ABD3III5_EUCGL